MASKKFYTMQYKIISCKQSNAKYETTLVIAVIVRIKLSVTEI